MKIKTVKMIEDSDWDELVKETYGRPYTFQQQNGCQDRGTFELTVPADDEDDEYMPETVPEIVNGDEMCVKFESWLARNPKQYLTPQEGDEDDSMQDFDLDLWWTRNFYPNIQSVANDLHKKGLLEAGEYVINIDW